MAYNTCIVMIINVDDAIKFTAYNRGIYAHKKRCPFDRGDTVMNKHLTLHNYI